MTKIDFRIEVPCSTSSMTVSEVMDFLDRMNANHPDREFYIDGETFSIVSVRRPKR